jgi:hypothetical protein
MKQNPFSLYDFMGYFIPGALTTYIFIFSSKSGNIEDVANLNNLSVEFQFDTLLFFTIISYSLGHLINFLSSITIERYANWKYNYPSKYLLNFNENHKFWKGDKIIKLWKFTLSIFLLPIVIFDFILGKLLNFKAFYTKKLDNFLIDIITKKGIILFDKLVHGDYDNIRNYDFNRIFAHYTYENSKNHQSKLTNYVVLYGFLRSLTFIVTLLFWYFIILIFNSYDSVHSLYCNIIKNTNLIVITTLLSLVTYIYFMAFMKFYRRYTLECLMLIAIDKELKVPITVES